jgi:putative PIN family toxin of toxin-antitoxin system
MSDQPKRFVFDCNIYLQALISPNGPASRCVAFALDGKLTLFASRYILDELLDVATRPELVAKFPRLTPERVTTLITNVEKVALFAGEFPEVYSHPFDPKDSHYVNLAVATGSELIVSRDRHLLLLMDANRPEGIDFRRRFPNLKICDPVALLLEIAPS